MRVMSQRQNREVSNHFTDIGLLRNNLTSNQNSMEKQGVLQHWPSDYIPRDEPARRNSRPEQTVGDLIRHPKYSHTNSSQKPPAGKLFAT